MSKFLDRHLWKIFLPLLLFPLVMSLIGSSFEFSLTSEFADKVFFLLAIVYGVVTFSFIFYALAVYAPKHYRSSRKKGAKKQGPLGIMFLSFMLAAFCSFYFYQSQITLIGAIYSDFVGVKEVKFADLKLVHRVGKKKARLDCAYRYEGPDYLSRVSSEFPGSFRVCAGNDMPLQSTVKYKFEVLTTNIGYRIISADPCIVSSPGDLTCA